MIFQLYDNELVFPDPALAEENGLLAIGGDLCPERLILAYRNGIFPWYSEDEPICWYSPHDRCVIFPENIYISSSIKKLLRKSTFTVTHNKAFEEVIAHCKNIGRKDQQGTWITDEMESAYNELHRLGVAHSIEVWKGDELAGGIYGLKINNVFCGESMFSKQSNASKLALIWLSQSGFCSQIDCQVPNDHLLSMGAEMIPRKQFIDLLNIDK